MAVHGIDTILIPLVVAFSSLGLFLVNIHLVRYIKRSNKHQRDPAGCFNTCGLWFSCKSRIQLQVQRD